MKSIHIQYATLHDVEAIIRIHHAAVHQTAAAYYSETILDNWSGPLTQNRIDRISAAISHPEKVVLTARAGRDMVGFGIVDLDKNYPGAIYVAPFMGRKQVGTALLNRLEALSRERGLTWLQLDASLNAEAFYLKHGYQVVEKSFHTLQSGLQMPCVKMVKRFSKTPLRTDFPDFKLKCLKAYIRLGEPGARRLLDAGRAWNLVPVLKAGGSVIFPHLAIEICGHQIAAAVHACLDSGAKRVLALGVIHASTPELNEARIRVAEGGDLTREASWGVQGPGLKTREDWLDEFSLDHFLFLWNQEVKRRNIKGPELILRYPYLAGGKPQIMPGMEELKTIAQDAVIVATMDPFHHGIGYGEPPASALWPEKGGLDLARRNITEGLQFFFKGDYWGYNQHSVQAKSDGRDVGQVLRYLIGPSQGSILDLVAEDTTIDYQQPAPTWVAGALMQLKLEFKTENRYNFFHQAGGTDMESLKKKAARANKIFATLDPLYTPEKTALQHKNPFQLLIATILSAQCTDKKVNEVTRVLFKKYKKPEDFLIAPLSELETNIRPTGFYHNKAKSIKGCSQGLVALFKGQVPANMEDMLRLPGVGRKTANVVLGAAFDIPGVVVDTHVKRLCQRLGLTENEEPDKIEKDVEQLLPKARWRRFSDILIYHGRAVCKSQKPDHTHCPVFKLCPSNKL